MTPIGRRVFAALACVVVAGTGAVVRAQAVVIDPSNLAQNLKTSIESAAQTAKQIEQYRTQLEQYENQLRNTKAPERYVWDQAQATIGQLQQAMDHFAQLEKEVGSLEALLAQWRDVDAYRRSECTGQGRCSSSDLAQLEETRRIGVQAQKRAGEDLLRGVEHQQKALVADAAALEKLQAQSQAAEGQMEALGASNQLASAEVNQLLQLRALLVAQQRLAAVQAQAQADREAQANAAHEEFLRRTDGYEPRKGRGW